MVGNNFTMGFKFPGVEANLKEKKRKEKMKKIVLESEIGFEKKSMK